VFDFERAVTLPRGACVVSEADARWEEIQNPLRCLRTASYSKLSIGGTDDAIRMERPNLLRSWYAAPDVCARDGWWWIPFAASTSRPLGDGFLPAPRVRSARSRRLRWRHRVSAKSSRDECGKSVAGDAGINIGSLMASSTRVG
jgi:hypothetical protein